MGRESARRGCFMRDERGFVWLHNLQRAQASHLLLHNQQASPLLTAARFNPLIHNLFVLSHLFSSYQAHTSLFVLTSTSPSSPWSSQAFLYCPPSMFDDCFSVILSILPPYSHFTSVCFAVMCKCNTVDC